MALEAGTGLGIYSITGMLGKGGMGEVYRARDTKLDREVAIKTLPAALADDKDRLTRFEREAKLLASLNHGHIASVYGLDEHEGTLYIAMELVEGETLEEKLKAGALPVEDALQLGLQIAEALEAAHEKGVVHRDLKPANVMVTANGVVKVLDFGLAKAFSGDPNAATPAHSPALSMAMTQAGLVLGTAGYMSPEQASGQATDQRADVWAFGVVLYEMLTGMPLFSGESVPHILADVLRADPDWSRLPQNLHPRIRELLERCLEKKPRSRYAGITDARADIEAALKDPDGVTPARLAARAAAPRRSPATRLATAAGLVIAGAAIAFLALEDNTPEAVPVGVSRLMLAPPPEYPFSINSFNPTLVISNDGRRILYSGAALGGVVNRPLDSLDATLLQARAATNLFLSPDGEWLGFVDFDAQRLSRIRLSGGSVAEIAALPGTTQPRGPRGAVWLESGDIVYTNQSADGLWRVPFSGGDPIRVTELDASRGETGHWWPSALPGGEWILYSAMRQAPAADIMLLNLVTGEQELLIEGGSDARYVPTGHIVFGFEGTLRAVPFDLASLEITGGPVPVLDGIVTANSGAAQFSFARNGTMVYAAGQSDDELSFVVVLVDAEGREESLPLSGDFYESPVLSPDGSRVALEAGGNIQIWSFRTGNQMRLTFEDGAHTHPAWSADGSRVVYATESRGLVARAADGTGSAELIYETGDEIRPYAWTADGEILVGIRQDAASNPTGLDIALLTPGESPSLETLIATPADEWQAALSPNGRFLAYRVDEPAGPQVYVSPFPDVGAGRWQVSIDEGREPIWSDDGSRIYFLASEGVMVSAVSTEPTFERETPALWETGSREAGRLRLFDEIDAYDMTADGERMITTRFSNADSANRESTQIVVVHNWFDELERLVPTGR